MNRVDITIASRFRGPPGSGNGGYVCGAFAELLDAPARSGASHTAAEVTLRSPVPLDTPLEVHHSSDGLITIRHGATLVAEARLGVLNLDIPAAPSFESAWSARAQSPSLVKGFNPRFPDRIGAHPVCFCCGAEHDDDGLQVYAAANADKTIVAAAWRTHRSWADSEGNLPARLVWTALDCPGQVAYYAVGIRTGMLGQLCAQIVQPVAAGERCVVIGWRIGIEGRKHFAGTALFNAAGTLCACAKAIWIGRREG